mgnify:CR=1 FL=1
MTALRTASLNWALGIGIGSAILLLNAYLEHKHGDVDALTAEVVNDRAAEQVAMKGPK